MHPMHPPKPPFSETNALDLPLIEEIELRVPRLWIVYVHGLFWFAPAIVSQTK